MSAVACALLWFLVPAPVLSAAEGKQLQLEKHLRSEVEYLQGRLKQHQDSDTPIMCSAGRAMHVLSVRTRDQEGRVVLYASRSFIGKFTGDVAGHLDSLGGFQTEEAKSVFFDEALKFQSLAEETDKLKARVDQYLESQMQPHIAHESVDILSSMTNSLKSMSMVVENMVNDMNASIREDRTVLQAVEELEACCKASQCKSTLSANALAPAPEKDSETRSVLIDLTGRIPSMSRWAFSSVPAGKQTLIEDSAAEVPTSLPKDCPPVSVKWTGFESKRRERILRFQDDFEEKQLAMSQDLKDSLSAQHKQQEFQQLLQEKLRNLQSLRRFLDSLQDAINIYIRALFLHDLHSDESSLSGLVTDIQKLPFFTMDFVSKLFSSDEESLLPECNIGTLQLHEDL